MTSRLSSFVGKTVVRKMAHDENLVTNEKDEDSLDDSVIPFILYLFQI